jgi:peroxiredoxin
MKNRLILGVVAFFSVFIFACKSKDESVFTISGTIKNTGQVKKVELLRLDSTDLSVADSATLDAEGKFTFKQTTPYPNLFRIKWGESVYDIIAKNGDEIEFNATAGKREYEAKGSQEEAELKEFNRISGFWGEKNTKLAAEYEEKAKVQGQSEELINIYRPAFQKNVRDYNQELLSFIDKNKTRLSAFFAASAVDPRANEQQLIAYADAIKDQFTDNPTVQHFVKQMLAVKPVSVGQKAQDFTIPGFDGKSIGLSDYKGKYVMLDFWASWCAPCRQENPNVVKQYNIYHSKGLNILGISLDDDKAKWQQAILADGLTWNHASSLKGFEGPVESIYQITAIPSNFIIDPNGIIVAKNITGAALEEFLNKTFNKPQ